MIETYTQNDVIRYVYDELKPEEKIQIETALLFDNSLSEFAEEASSMKRELSSCAFPSQHSLDNIMLHARLYNVPVA